MYRSALQIVIVSFIVAATAASAAGTAPMDEDVTPAICEVGLKTPLTAGQEKLYTVQKLMARFVASLIGAYGHFEKFERINEVDGNLHIYMLYTAAGRSVHTVAVLDGATGKIVELVGPDSSKSTGVSIWRPKSK